jgi:hypothetical protein
VGDLFIVCWFPLSFTTCFGLHGDITCNTHWTIQCSRMLKYRIWNSTDKLLELWVGFYRFRTNLFPTQRFQYMIMEISLSMDWWERMSGRRGDTLSRRLSVSWETGPVDCSCTSRPDLPACRPVMDYLLHSRRPPTVDIPTAGGESWRQHSTTFFFIPNCILRFCQSFPR